MSNDIPAFPSVCLGDPGHPASASGMSLRDWFAGQALISMGTWMPPCATGMLNADETMRQRSDWAYRHADAMIAQRAITEKQP